MQTDVLADTFPYRRGRRWQQVFELLPDSDSDKDARKEERQALMRSIFAEGGYKATVDFPGSMFAEDLVEMYPDAKVLLTCLSVSLCLPFASF